MQTILSTVRGALKDRRGITALEYGLIGAIITVVVVGGLGVMKTPLQTGITALTTAVSTATGGGGGGTP